MTVARRNTLSITRPFTLEETIIRLVDERIEAKLGRANAGLVDVCEVVPASRRCLMAACRRGEIVGAVRIARRWLAPQPSVDAFLQGHAATTAAPAAEDEAALEEQVRASLVRPARRASR